MRSIILSIVLIVASVGLFAQKHWESIVVEGDYWKYQAVTSAVSDNWNQRVFNDNSWDNGFGGIGYADNDDRTVLTPPVNSLYLRYKFVVSDLSIISKLVLDIDYDDAFVCYINGVEVARSFNITAEAPTFDSPLTTDHEANIYQGGLPERFNLEPSMLVEGLNIIAIQILNTDTNSSDMSARVFLNAEVDNESLIYKTTPSWFVPPFDAEDGTLPIIMIITDGQSIPDEPKITAQMKVINNLDSMNNITDTVYEYDGLIGIEIRGNSSQMFEKKSFSLETRNEDGSNQNVELLGMPKENDWILYGPYSDKSLARNVLAYELGRSMGRWSPRTRYCELYINSDYRGIYLLTERIKIDENRLNISKLKEDDIVGDELTGGYILKIGRPETGAWISPYMGRTGSAQVPINYIHPEYEQLNNVQRNYIKDYITNFENVLNGDDFADPLKGYRPLINIQSFADYFLLNELTRNLDGYRVSTYFYKDKDSEDGRITMGPFWDYNLGFGNGNFFAAGNPVGWIADGLGRGDAYEIPFWWDKLRSDPFFESELRKRWDYLRANSYSNENINAIIDSCVNEIGSAQIRNFQRFNILGRYIWPNAYVGQTYFEEVVYLKSWIEQRLTWMDQEIGKFDLIPDPVEESVLPIISINTEGRYISTGSKSIAWMKVVNNSDGLNTTTNVYDFDYYGNIGIEATPNHDESVEKINYSFETRNQDQTNNNTSLLGMPKENDWELIGPYADKTMIRNVLANQLATQLGRWNPRTQYCELFIDGDYRGVYVLTEKIKKGDDRIDLANLKSDDLSGDDLTGGYVLKIGQAEEGYWQSPFNGRAGKHKITYNYIYPDFSELKDNQEQYIKDHITHFENVLQGESFKDPEAGYRPMVDLQSFSDFYLLSELSKNTNAYRLNTYLYKDKDSKDGKITMGSQLDYSIAFGNANFSDAEKTEGWIADGIGNDEVYDIPFWWDKLRSDAYFEIGLRKRWEYLRTSTFSNAAIYEMIDSCATVLNPVYDRNFSKFDLLGEYIWPNAFVGETYAEEVNYLKSWIDDRLEWMDQEISKISLIPDANTELAAHLSTVSVYPNPFEHELTMQFYSNTSKVGQIAIYSSTGQHILTKAIEIHHGNNTIKFSDELASLQGHLFIYQLSMGDRRNTGLIYKKQ